MESVDFRLVHDNFRKLSQSLTLDRGREAIGDPVFIDYEDVQKRFFITAKKEINESGQVRTVLYLAESQLNANVLTPNQVQPERALQNSQWTGSWIRVGTNQTGVANLLVTLRGALKGELLDNVSGEVINFNGDLKAPLRFYAADIVGKETVLSSVYGNLEVSLDANSMTVILADLEKPESFRLDLTNSFRGRL